MSVPTPNKVAWRALGWIAISSLLSTVASGRSLIESFDRSVDRLADNLIKESGDGLWYGEAAFTFDTWYYHRDDPDYFQGFWFPDEGDHARVSARATLELFAEYKNWFSITGKFRLDDGNHPGMGSYLGKDGGQLRTDEAFLFFSLSPALDLRVGQFTPRLTSFLERQDSWSSGLINSPMAYEATSSVADFRIPTSEESFVNWRNYVNPFTWIPAIWAPLYPKGIELSGETEHWGYSLAYLNASLSSRPEWWNDDEFDYPTVAGRLTFSPSPMWTFGATASAGTYLHYADSTFSDGLRVLPAGTDFDDFKQVLYGVEAAFAAGGWEIWSEAFWVSYDVPNVRDEADYLSYFVEMKYNLTPKIWLSARWNEELFHELDTANGPTDWVYDRNRIDLGIGYRFSRHAQAKAQIARQHSAGPKQFGETMLLFSTTFRL